MLSASSAPDAAARVGPMRFVEQFRREVQRHTHSVILHRRGGTGHRNEYMTQLLAGEAPRQDAVPRRRARVARSALETTDRANMHR